MPGRAAVWPQKHLWAPRAWVHTTDTAQVREGSLAGVTGAIKLLGDVFLVCAGMVQQLALTRIVSAITATHSALWGPLAGHWAQACSSLPISRAHACTAEAAGYVGAGVPGPTGPVAEQADAPLQDTLCTLQLAFVAIGGGI